MAATPSNRGFRRVPRPALAVALCQRFYMPKAQRKRYAHTLKRVLGFTALVAVAFLILWGAGI